MAQEQSEPLPGPDLMAGVLLNDIPDGGMLLGHVEDEAALLARQGNEAFAVSAYCTHYHGLLTEGILVGDTVRCPLHHACFSLRTGEALKAPALFPLTCWKVTKEGDRVKVTGRKPDPKPKQAPTGVPESVVIIGGGAAGAAAAEMLRREGYPGPVTIISAENALPSDRPNLSKDYLAGTAPEEWVPIVPQEFYDERQITLRLGTRVTQLDPVGKTVILESGEVVPFGAALLATGATPVHLPIPGADLPHVHYLRSAADSKAIIATAEGAKRAVVIGASFIGLEVVASLRHRGIETEVVAPEAHLFTKVFGSEVGDFVQGVHEANGVHFHLGEGVSEITKKAVILTRGEILLADMVIIGTGVRPNVTLGESAGLTLDRGIVVDEFLQTSTPGVYAAGDIARYPDPCSGKSVRIEHWVVAERQGQTAARNILGRQEKYTDPAFFWSQHYDVVLSYIGHTEGWTRYEIEGNLSDRDAKVTYYEGDRAAAVLTLSRDRDSLRTEAAWESIVV
jgi:NADPH-dependent 2,4-dienoyl-CoA reductase/sulfur reductase-like enzyme/nitrite reductase/ring-hydroxylating ferredoxin subunit